MVAEGHYQPELQEFYTCNVNLSWPAINANIPELTLGPIASAKFHLSS